MKSYEPKEFWERRIDNGQGRLKSVGHLGYGDRVNQYIYQAKFNILKKLFSEISLFDKKVLDAGCGIGVFSQFYTNKKSIVVGIDISKNAVQYAKQKVPNAYFLVSKLDLSPFKDETFDIIHCFDVSYHIVDNKDWKESLTEFSRIIKKDGLLIILEGWRSKEVYNAAHVRFRSKDIYVSELENLGFQKIREHELYLILQTYRRLTKLFPKLSLKLESLFKFKIFKKIAKAKIIIFKKE
ncbi:Ubiquinone/menaquinone biosynthesis C-methylase UbiE [Methanophagales archaeon]|nr:Ubiquinone/menaquinone biosynthesis C-methylase UbiE [Methanophagales archaeon]